MKFITPGKALSHPEIFRVFSVPKHTSAQLVITGLGLYQAYINGQRVGDAYLTPGFNDYDAYLRVQTYDVTSLLMENNRISVLLGDGWYMGRFGVNGGRSRIYGDQYLLAVKLIVDGATVLETDNNWQARDSQILFSNIYDGEVRDDTRVLTEPVWCSVVKVRKHLVPDFAPPVRKKQQRKPTLITSPKGESILDFGQNMAGFVCFENNLPSGTKLLLQYGEVLQDGCFFRGNYGSARAEYEYTSDGLPKWVEPLFTFYGFRYVKVLCDLPVCPNDFLGVALYSDLRDTLECRTANPKVNQLIQNTIWGQRSNFLDVPTDCPQRDERLGWTGDAQVFAETACYQMDCADFFDKYLRDMRYEQETYFEGDLPMYAPSLRGFCEPGGAAWGDAGTVIPWTLWRFYGDAERLASHYPIMRDYSESLIRKDIGGGHILFDGFAFGDWLSQDVLRPQIRDGSTDHAYIKSMYYWLSIYLTASAAGVLGYADDAARYENLASEIRKAILDEFFTPAGRLSVDTQTGYALALSFGIWRDKARVVEGMRARLKKDSYQILCGFVGTPLLLPALFDAGLTEEAYRILLQEELPGWLYGVNLGATTTWEKWTALQPDTTIRDTDMCSLNHYAFGSVCGAIYARIAGLCPASPGWKTAVIKPHISWMLPGISLAYDSRAGRYSVSWHIQGDGTVCVKCEVPEGAAAQVILETGVFDVAAGTHQWVYSPAADYVHPFSADTPVNDLFRHSEAGVLVRERIPVALDFRGYSLREIAGMLPFISQEVLQATDDDLKRIKMVYEKEGAV